MIALASKATLILLAAFAAAWLLRNRSAALRHSVWTAAFAALLLLPLSLLTPAWAPAPALPDTGITRLIVTPAAPPAPASPAVPWLAILYAAGCALAAARFVIGAARTAWISRCGPALPGLS